MPDSPDQIICKLQQENKKLKKTLKQKDEELNRERQLWNNRETGWDPSTSTDLHRIEVFDGVISDESSLHSATLCSREEFRYILERAGACATASGDMPLFRDDESRMSDPGNRCKLRLRHALLMSLIRKKDKPNAGHAAGDLRGRPDQRMQVPQGDGPDTGICAPHGQEHLKRDSRVRDQGGIQKNRARAERGRCHRRRHALPGAAPVGKDRPAHDVLGKEETVYLQHQRRRGGNRDIAQLRGLHRRHHAAQGGTRCRLARWAESMRDSSTPEEDRIRIWADRGYQGTGKDLPGATLMIPHKRSKNHRTLTAEQKEHNHLVNSTRVRVEHSIGRLKRYARLADPYDGTISQFNHEFNVITGLVNLHLLWDKIDKGPPSPGRWGTSIDWSGAVPPASGAPF